MKSIVLFLVAIVTVSVTTCQPIEPWAAEVNGEVIPSSVILGDLDTVVSNPVVAAIENQDLGGTEQLNLLQPGGSNTVNSSYTVNVVSQRIYTTLLMQDIAKNKVTPTDEEKARAESAVSQNYDPGVFDALNAEYKKYLIDRSAALYAGLRFRSSPEKLRAYYDSHPDEFTSECIRHILVTDKPKADQLRESIAGGTDFAAIAKAESIDNQAPESSAFKGGDLGCFKITELSNFITPFADAVKTLEVNQLSQPVQTQFGYHLIQITSRTLQTFEESQAAISQKLSDSSAYVSELLNGAKIEINPRYGEYVPPNELTGQQATVQPHQPVELNDGSSSEDDHFLDDGHDHGDEVPTTPES